VFSRCRIYFQSWHKAVVIGIAREPGSMIVDADGDDEYPVNMTHSILRCMVLAMFAVPLCYSCGAQTSAGGKEAATGNQSSPGGKCDGKNGMDWWDCCVKMGPTKDASCLAKQLASEISLPCENGSPQACLGGTVGSWRCTGAGEPHIVRVDQRGLLLSESEGSPWWDKYCISCDSKFSGLDYWSSRNAAIVGQFASDPGGAKASWSFGYCPNRTFAECIADPEQTGGMSCTRTDAAPTAQ